MIAGCGRISFDEQGMTSDSGPNVDCWAAWRTGQPSFGPVEHLTELADPEKHGNPFLTSDGLTLFFDLGTGTPKYFARNGNRAGTFRHPLT